jgi:hypothetical protein
MRRTLVSSATILSLALALFAARAHAAPQDLDVFTNFEGVSPNTSVGEVIEVGTSPESAELSGDAFGGFLGVGQLYHSGIRSWMVVQNGTGFIDFITDAAEVQFWATAHSSANGNTVITAFDSSHVMIGPAVTITPGSGFQLVSFSGAIASIEVENNASNQMNGIDDFGFTPAAPDADGDGTPDADDNCPNTPNSGQVDVDSDGAGDVCDNCLNTPNGPLAYAPGLAPNSQCDRDSDGYGNACDGDLDQDGFVSPQDNPLYLAALMAFIPPPPGQSDMDCDGFVTPLDNPHYLTQLMGFLPGPSGWSCAGIVVGGCPPLP